MDLEALLFDVTEIIKETGFSSLLDFPKLYTPETKEDKELEALLISYIENKENYEKLFKALSSYIQLDDINMGLMAKAAEVLKEGENGN